MTPGRSLSANTSGRSCAPVASTTCAARTCHRRWRTAPAGASAPRWSVRRSATTTQVGVVVADRRRAREHAHLGRGGQALRDARHPVQRGLAVERLARAEQAAARLGLVVDEDHARAGAGGGVGRGEAGRPGADHEHVAVHVHVVVAGAVGARPPGARDRSGSRRRRPSNSSTSVARSIGSEPPASCDLDERVRLLGPRGDDPARAPVGDRVRDHVDARGEQRRGQRVTAQPFAAPRRRT